ncbi:4-hydroxybenzoate polyprenyltransferase [Streptomyces sp. SLBN-118]|uniref:SCO3242 family prenyltransferase n=1 Tax=Streptomyces sp. SLBN-118 TaxID=2768454 RepID=UPI001154C06A|nr:UbiA family prenyltransferase [Streptomyces sp. SLBN-118]TQK50914.1 4-hydroxybenzoate polyprenyltransferase [Streptomyces sp. SLBN-118]
MTWRAWAELLRVSALFTVPGDALAGAAAAGVRANGRTLLAVGSSLCLYEAGMALNDWADREEDAVERPHRPIPSGRVSPAAALGAAGALTGAGLVLASRAGRPALAVASALSATVWSYDLYFKHTAGGPAAMAAARGLDLVLGAVATSSGAARPGAGSGAGVGGAGVPGVLRGAYAAGVGRPGVLAAVPSAAVLAAHTYAVTTVSRHEAQGGSTVAPLVALAATLGLGALAAGVPHGPDAPTSARAGRGRVRGRELPALPVPAEWPEGLPAASGRGGAGESPRPSPRPPAPQATLTTARLASTALAAAYVRTAAKPLLHAALNPSPPLTQRAVGGGIRAMIPLQATLAARTGAGATALAVMALVPLARNLARKVSVT